MLSVQIATRNCGRLPAWLDADLERGDMKSNVSDYLEMATCVYLDAVAMCVADVSDLRDLKTIKSRVKEEGLSFLTITLPNFGKDFERSLEIGYIDPAFFRSFKKNGAIPAFLQGMLGLIFDHETGSICNEQTNLSSGAVSTIIDCVRQICLTFKKVELPCTPKRVQDALEEFTTIEQSFTDFRLLDEDHEDFLRVSSLLWRSVFSYFVPDTFVPRHGPGATAERISGNGKFLWQYWHDRLEPYFPFLEYAYPIGMGVFPSKELDSVKYVRAGQEQPVRVTPVPKTLKGPRIIAIEPCCMQYIQQGIRDFIYEAIESNWLTRGHINFRDQGINQSHAILSSMTGRLATIDLSDASDRVPLSMSIRMFDSYPELKGAILACRSTSAILPNGEIISPLRKFASMGSALCFPVEAMYFYTICIVALLREQKLPVSLDSIFMVSRHLYVYGDDIVAPSMYATTVLDHLRKYNCKVNTSKTFFTGKFRESCGVDAYLGRRVTPIYLRKPFPENRQQASEIVSHVATANLFYKKGFWRTCSLLFKRVEKLIGNLPYVSETSPALGRYSFLGYKSIGRWNKRTQTFEVKAWVPSPVYRTDRLEGYGALQKSFQKLEGLLDPFVSRDALHLERSALHGAVALTRRWVTTS